jgi:HK97 family phage major capsid protein
MTPEQLLAQMGQATSHLNDTADAVEALARLGFAKASDGQWRRTSKAHLIAGGGPDLNYQSGTGGEFIKALMFARGHDADEQAQGKARLAELGGRFVEDPGTSGRMFVDDAGKATLGTTDATGGWVMPNALVDEITKAEGYTSPWRTLLNVRRNVLTASVDIPLRASRPARATIALPGATKENVDLVYGGYTATMYTIARIYDLGKQYVRYSAGAAEADVMQELSTALGLGEAYYARQGSGTNEPYGLYTALTVAPATFTSSHTPSATSLAGSVLKAIATCLGALASRGITNGVSALISGTAWGAMISQGSDTAGFYIPEILPAPGIRPGTILTPWGTPVYVDDQATDDRLVVGQFKQLTLYVGADYRIDSSDVAGSRWDSNLVGFRGEEDIALDARAAVMAGRFQQVTDLLP